MGQWTIGASNPVTLTTTGLCTPLVHSGVCTRSDLPCLRDVLSDGLWLVVHTTYPTFALIAASTTFSACLFTLFVVLLVLSSKKPRYCVVLRLKVAAIYLVSMMGVFNTIGFFTRNKPFPHDMFSLKPTLPRVHDDSRQFRSEIVAIGRKSAIPGRADLVTDCKRPATG
ncbi:hypothetical protein EV401DRAFT_1913156 [Pisolithus croceorrhizus]|nr:hypothetical protein EV401DRAFT_1913156 [Pisolithus croceorrhizus]